jgi:hypothetical protein
MISQLAHPGPWPEFSRRASSREAASVPARKNVSMMLIGLFGTKLRWIETNRSA